MLRATIEEYQITLSVLGGDNDNSTHNEYAKNPARRPDAINMAILILLLQRFFELSRPAQA